MSGSAAAGGGDTTQASVFDKIKDKPLHVEIIILKKGRTQQYIIEKELQPILEAKSLEDLTEKLIEAQAALEALNVFEAVQLVLDRSPNVGD